MNLTSQYVSNPKSRVTYLKSLATYKAMRSSNAKLRLGDDRQVLNDKKKYKIFRVDDVDFKMIRCSRGKFTMGSDDKYDKNPKRLVSIEQPFLLGETEVTEDLFEAVMGFNPSYFSHFNYHPKLPVESVTWYDAVMFCNKLSIRLGKIPYYNISNIENETIKITDTNGTKEEEGPSIVNANLTINVKANGFRLPLEKEWEYAAKAGTNNKWAGTDQEDTLGDFACCVLEGEQYGDHHQPQTVKSRAPNEWGFYDMSGNMSEWCWDETIENVTTVILFLKKTEIVSTRRIKGGSWSDMSFGVCSSFSSSSKAQTRTNEIGFRIAMHHFE